MRASGRLGPLWRGGGPSPKVPSTEDVMEDVPAPAAGPECKSVQLPTRDRVPVYGRIVISYCKKSKLCKRSKLRYRERRS